MTKVTTESINQLHTNALSPAVTIYLPTHRAATPPHMREDELRFKNLAEKASDILNNIDKHDPFNFTFAAQCAGLLKNELFWEDRTEGVLVCASPGQFDVYDLTMPTDEYVAVDHHNHLTPVYGLIEDMTPFHVLAITQDGAFLFAGDDYNLELVEHELFLNPHHAKNETHIYEAERHRYFKGVDESFFAKSDKKLPLILAGVNADVAKYRSLSNYPRILDQYITGSYGSESAHELFPAGVRIVDEQVVEAKHQEKLADYQRLKHENSELASDEVANIKDAAEKGRVDTLLIGMSRSTMDTVDDSVEPAKKIIFPDEIESQAVDYLARMVWSQQGHVINIHEDQLPGSSLLYALYRY
jgi:hypothetical protein